MRFVVLTLFPEQADGGLRHGVIGKALDAGLFGLEYVQIRDFAVNRRGQVDDYPYGGGAGMVMMAEPVYGAYLRALEMLGRSDKRPRVIYLTPQGRRLDQRLVEELAAEESLILLCGHYEGVDERVLEEIVTDEVSLGDFVLTGGEIAAAALIDAVARLLPGVLGNEGSAVGESFSAGGGDGADGNLLEYPQYTRPVEWRGRDVPEALVSGHHAKVDAWRREMAVERTRVKRPDLLKT